MNSNIILSFVTVIYFISGICIGVIVDKHEMRKHPPYEGIPQEVSLKVIRPAAFLMALLFGPLVIIYSIMHEIRKTFWAD